MLLFKVSRAGAPLRRFWPTPSSDLRRYATFHRRTASCTISKVTITLHSTQLWHSSDNAHALARRTSPLASMERNRRFGPIPSGHKPKDEAFSFLRYYCFNSNATTFHTYPELSRGPCFFAPPTIRFWEVPHRTPKKSLVNQKNQGELLF